MRLGGSLALLDSYRRLSLQGIIVRGVVEQHALSSAHAHDHVEIAEAVAAATFPAREKPSSGTQIARAPLTVPLLVLPCRDVGGSA